MFFADDSTLGGWVGNHFIVTAPDPGPAVRYAAHQFQEYLRRIRGKSLRIVATDQDREPHHLSPLRPCVYVGPSPLLAERLPAVSGVHLEPEEIFVWKENDTVVLTGGSDRAVLYAVYTFLEKYLGIRFVASDAEYVPQTLASLPARIDWRDKPVFEYRDMVAVWRAAGDWAAKNRMNGHFSNVTSLQGGRAAFLPICHSWGHLMPAEKYYAKHPEFYSEIAGERVPRQLCLSNPDVRDLCKEELRRWVRAYPDFSIFEVSENDGGGWCECDRCRKLNADDPTKSRIVMDFVNELAADVGAAYPGTRVSTLSYATNRYPYTGLEVEPNVVIRLCTDAEIKERLTAWREVTSNIYIWHYYINRFFPYLDGLQRAARYFQEQGVSGVFVETAPSPNFGGIEPLPLRLYAVARLLWNPAVDTRPHIEDFMTHYYGPAACELVDCLDRAYALKREMKLGGKYGWSDGWDGFYPMHEYMSRLAERCRPAIAAARRKTRNTPYAQRVAEATVPFLLDETFGESTPPRFDRDRAYPRDIRGRARAAKRLEEISRRGGFVLPEQKALRPTPLVRLKRGNLEVLVLPEVGGRIVQISYGSPPVTLIPMENDLNDFQKVGFEEYAGRFFGGPGRYDAFRVVGRNRERSADSVTLNCRLTDEGAQSGQQAHGAPPLPEGLVIRREYRVTERDRIECRTVLTNRADTPLEGCVRVHPRLAYDPDRDAVAYTTAAGADRRCLIAEFAAMLNREHVFVSDAGATAPYLEGNELPAGALSVLLHSRSVRLTFRFDPKRVEKVLLVGNKSGRFTLDLVAKARMLEPGRQMTFRYAMDVTAETGEA